MISLSSSKKGVSPRVMFTIIGGLITFGVLAVVGVYLLDAILTAFETNIGYTDSMQTAANYFQASYYWWDYITIFILAFFVMGVAITSYRLKAKPIGFIISFIVAPFYGFISYYFNYYFVQIISVQQFKAVQAYFPITMIICTNLHWVALITLIVGAVFAYNYHTDGEGGGRYLA